MSAYAAAERAKADWEKGFSALIWFGKTRGHLRVPNSYHAPRTGFHLADWMASQRTERSRLSQIRLARVGAGHSVTALYEVKSHEGASGVAATVFLRYEDAETGSVTETSSEFHLDEMSATFEQAAPRFQLAAAFAEFAEVLQNSYWALDGNLTDARMLAQRVSDLLPEDADVTQFAGLVAGAEGIGQ